MVIEFKNPAAMEEAMFQTEIHIALQSLASNGLTWLMRQITATGYYQFVVALVIAVMLGISLRKGFLLFQIIAWTGMVSEVQGVLRPAAAVFRRQPRPLPGTGLGCRHHLPRQGGRVFSTCRRRRSSTPSA